MKISEKLLEKVEVGDSMTNKELATAVEFYADLEESLNYLGKEYNLATRPIRETLYRLQGYQMAREQ